MDNDPKFPKGNEGVIAARQYLYGVLWSMLDTELNGDNLGKLEGWVFGGIETEHDKKLLIKAIERLKSSVRKKAGWS